MYLAMINEGFILKRVLRHYFSGYFQLSNRSIILSRLKTIYYIGGLNIFDLYMSWCKYDSSDVFLHSIIKSQSSCGNLPCFILQAMN